MKKIIIGFSKAKSSAALFSRAICWAQKSPFSHVYIKLNWATINKPLIYQASGLKVNFESGDHFLTHATTIAEFELEINDEIYINIAQFMYSQLDKPYSMKQIFGMLCVIIGQKIGIKIDNPYKNRLDAFVCSELGANILQITGIQTDDSENMGPIEVFDLLNSLSLTGQVKSIQQ